MGHIPRYVKYGKAGRPVRYGTLAKKGEMSGASFPELLNKSTFKLVTLNKFNFDCWSSVKAPRSFCSIALLSFIV